MNTTEILNEITNLVIILTTNHTVTKVTKKSRGLARKAASELKHLCGEYKKQSTIEDKTK